MRCVLVLAVAVTALLAGCSSQSSSNTVSFPTIEGIDVGISVYDAHIEDGRCFDRSTAFKEECHVVRLRFDNSKNDLDVKTRLDWSASDVAGGGVSHGDLAGPSTVAAGKQADLTIRFTTPKGAPHLDEVVFSGFPNANGQAPIPAY